MSQEKKLLLIDGLSVAFRAFFGLHSQIHRMKNKSGLHTNALYGFHNMLEKVLEKEAPTHAMVAFDAGKTTFRHEHYKDYKGGRDSMPSEFAEQIPYIKELIKAFGVNQYELENYEADDIIGTLSRSAEKEGFQVVVLTGDRDLTQLATQSTRVDITKKGVSDIQENTPESIQEDLGIEPIQVIDMKGLAGDKSDNIPGVTGIGDKTALKLLKEYETVENLYANIDHLKKSKRKENLVNEKDTALLSKKLATIDVAAPIKVKVNDLTYQGKNLEKLIEFYKEMDFNSHLEKLDTSDYYEELHEGNETIDYHFVKQVKEDMFSGNVSLYMERLELNYHHFPADAYSWKSEGVVYVAYPETLYQSAVFQKWAKEENNSKHVFDAKSIYVTLHLNGIQLNGIDFDLSLASNVLTSEDTSATDFADIAAKHGFDDIYNDEMIYGKGKKRSLPDNEDEFFQHLAKKADCLGRLKEKMEVELEANNQSELFKEIELPLAIVLADMEIIGITADRNRLLEMKAEFTEVLSEIEEKIYQEAGEEFNINSPKQLGVILFEKMGYPVIKKTKTGYSTAQDVLEKLKDQAPIVEYILHYRTISKIQSTYVEGLLKEIDEETGRIHTRYLQTVARTGRLSSVDPNLQNIPIRLEEGRKIRQAFVSNQEEWKIFGADYSQIELRVLAHFSKDEELIRIFNEEEDVHTMTAMRVFDLESKDQVTSNMRREAKAVNFGIVYGISDYGLSQNLDIPRKDAKEYIDTYFDRFPGVKQFIDDVIRDAKDKGYVETLFHRRRYLPDINSRNFNLRSFAERTAMNSPIQGSAADIIKVAMIEMDKVIKREGLKANMLLQVHDELIFEVPEDEINRLEELVKEVMENAVELIVPLIVDSDIGDSWYDAK